MADKPNFLRNFEERQKQGLVTQPEPEGSGLSGIAGDVASTAGRAVVGLGQGLFGLANLASGGHIESGIKSLTGESMAERFQRTQQAIGSLASPELQGQRQELAEAEGFTESAGAVLTNPRLALATVGETVPQILAPGGLARAAATRVISAGGTKLAAQKAAERAAIAGGAALGAGSGNLQAQQEVEDLPIETLRQNPSFNELVRGGMSEDEARSRLARTAGTVTGLTTGALTGLASKVTGGAKLEADVFTPGAKVGGVASKAGAVAKETVEETLQSGGEQASTNIGVGLADLDRTVGEGVTSAAGAGAALGFLAGGGLTTVDSLQGAAAARRKKREEDTQTGADTLPLAGLLQQRPEDDGKTAIFPDGSESADPDIIESYLDEQGVIGENRTKVRQDLFSGQARQQQAQLPPIELPRDVTAPPAPDFDNEQPTPDPDLTQAPALEPEISQSLGIDEPEFTAEQPELPAAPDTAKPDIDLVDPPEGTVNFEEGLAAKLTEKAPGYEIPLDENGQTFERGTADAIRRANADDAGAGITTGNEANKTLQPDTAQGMFAGVNAAAYKPARLDDARQRIQAGEKPANVLQDTGWWMGTDGEMRFEVSDADAQLKGVEDIRNAPAPMEWLQQRAANKPDPSKRLTVGDILEHNVLFETYPHLANLGVGIKKMGPKGHGNYTASAKGPEQGAIMIGQDSDADLFEVRNTILHELQHAVQDFEGFDFGGSVRMFQMSDEDVEAARGRRRQLKGQIERGIQEMRGQGKGQAEIRQALKKPIEEYEGLGTRIQQAKDPFKWYQRIAGEGEARNTEKRRTLTDEQRRAVNPDQTSDLPAGEATISTRLTRDGQTAKIDRQLTDPDTGRALQSEDSAESQAPDEISPLLREKGKNRVSFRRTEAEPLENHPDLEPKYAEVFDALIKLGFPAKVLNDVRSIGVFNNPDPNSMSGGYYPESSVVAIRRDALLGDEATLRHYVAHEYAHDLDFTGTNDAASHTSEQFAIDLDRVTLGDNGISWEDGAMGPVMEEIVTDYMQNGPSYDTMGYPLHGLALAVLKKDAAAIQTIKSEVFAQIAALYYTDPQKLINAPTARAMMDKVHNASVSTRSDFSRRNAVRKAIQSKPSAGSVSQARKQGDAINTAAGFRAEPASGGVEPGSQDAQRRDARPAEGTEDKTVPTEAEQPQAIKAAAAWKQGLTPTQQTAVNKIRGSGKQGNAKTILTHLKGITGLSLRQGIADQFAALKDVDQRLFGDINSKSAQMSSWILARMSKASGGGVEAAFEDGRLKLTDGALDVDAQGKGLAQTLQPLGDEVDRFFAWIVGNRASKLSQEDRENLFTDPEIAGMQTLNQGTLKDGSSRAKLYANVWKEFDGFQSSVLDIAEQTGLISQDDRQRWQGQFYVPFYRIMEEHDNNVRGPRTLGGLTNQQAYKKLKGGTEMLADPLGNTLMNWNHLIQASMKNQAAARALDNSEQVGAARKIPERDKGKNSVFVLEDGKKVWYDVDEPLVLEALTALNWEGFNNRIVKTMSAMKRLFTQSITINPEFKIANALRDTISAMATKGLDTKAAGVNNFFGGLRATKKDSLARARMRASGGFMAFSNIAGEDPDAAKKGIRKLTATQAATVLTDDNPAAWEQLKNAAGKMWDGYTEVSDRIENANRAKLYNQVLDETGDHLRASFEARDLLDFSQQGAWPAVRFLTQVVPFLNARIQGLDVLGRSAADKNQRKQLIAVTGAVALASMALYAANADDEEFKKREEWDRDSYWWFKIPGTEAAFRIPKPFEVGAIGTLAERGLEQIIDDDVNGRLFLDRLGHMLTQTFNVNPVPQALQPVLDVYANKDSFTGRDIETPTQQNMSPTERKSQWTSQTAIALSNALDKITFGAGTLSPVQIDSLIEGYLGWVGASTLGAVDMVARPLLGEGERPTLRLQDYPVFGRFVRELPSDRTKYTTMFWDQLKSANQAYGDMQYYRQMGDLKRALEIKEDKKDELRKRGRLRSAQRRLQKINRQIKKVTANDRLTGEEKRQRLDRLNQIRSRITEVAIKREIKLSS